MMKLGSPYPTRKKLIETLRKTKPIETFGVRFQGKFQHIPIYSVSIEFPKYRLENGRTGAAQEEYVATHKGIPSDFFTKDTESDAAQNVQHDILKEMIGQSGLHAYFKKKEQEDPLILTNEGIVINGNRRLCSMREYFDTDNEKFERYRNISVIILPPAADMELDWLEGKEQIQEDIKAGYSWTATAIMYRRRMSHHKLKVKDLAAIYEIKKPTVQALLDMLVHAENFLQGQGKNGQYHTVDKDELAFSQLKKIRGRIKDVAKREVFDQLCYAVIEHPIGDRAYQSVADIQKYFEKIVKGLEEELLQKPTTSEQPTPDSEKKSASALLGGPKYLLPDVLYTVSDMNNRPKVRLVLKDVIASEKAASKEKKDSSYVSSQIRYVSQALKRAVDDVSKKSSKSSKSGVGDQLDEVD